MFEFLWASAKAIMWVGIVVACDVLTVAMRRITLFKSLPHKWLLWLWLSLGAYGLIQTLANVVVPELSSPLLKTAALSFYFSLALLYLETKSLLSRGYSLRVLIELWLAGGCLRPDDLKRSYGDGRGVDWLLRKRLDGLVIAHLAVERDSRYGISSAGRPLAWFADQCRSFLKLSDVG